MKFEADPVAYVECSRKEPIDDGWSSEASTIVLADGFHESALLGIEDFSHIEITFFFHQVDPACLEHGARHPRDNSEWPRIGIFAQRAKNRPNRIGHTTCRLVQREGRRLHVVDLDCIDGTPVLDIKPFVQSFHALGAYRQPSWIGQLMLEYWKQHATAPWLERVDYEGLKAAFSRLPKPSWVKGDSYDLDMDEDRIQSLIDRDPDTLRADDFDGYVDSYVSGGVEDMRYLLPPMLRIWEEGLYGHGTAFNESFHAKLLRVGVIGKYLSPQQNHAVSSFMRRALSTRIATEDSLDVRGSSTTHVWIGDFNAFGAIPASFSELWTEVFSARCRGHAVAVLQYIASLVYDEADNPVFAADTCNGGGPLGILSANFISFDWQWTA